MEKFSATTSLDQTELELPPGFRFHPTDEELITHYLYPKVMDNNFSTLVIGEVDLNKVEPWELPWRAKMGEKEWYFYSKRDRKYPTGSRTNRASKAGYWKTTGKDIDIFKKRTLFGMKKTLVFYKGRAPNGEKTNWVMHEYRLVGNLFESIESCYAEKNEYVLCRIFKKSSGGKKVDISSMKNNQKDDSVASNLPTLIDLSSDEENPKRIMAVDSPNVSCFSSFLMDKNPLLDNNLIIPDFPSSSSMSASVFSQNLMVSSQSGPSYIDNLQYTDLSFMQEQPVLGVLLDEQGNGQNANVGFCWENDMCNYYPPLHNNANVDFNCLWN